MERGIKYRVWQQLGYKVEVEKISTLPPFGLAGGDLICCTQLFIKNQHNPQTELLQGSVKFKSHVSMYAITRSLLTSQLGHRRWAPAAWVTWAHPSHRPTWCFPLRRYPRRRRRRSRFLTVWSRKSNLPGPILRWPFLSQNGLPNNKDPFSVQVRARRCCLIDTWTDTWILWFAPPNTHYILRLSMKLYPLQC